MDSLIIVLYLRFLGLRGNKDFVRNTQEDVEMHRNGAGNE